MHYRNFGSFRQTIPIIFLLSSPQQRLGSLAPKLPAGVNPSVFGEAEMGGMDVTVHCTALDALVLSEERVLSFRALSSLLKMPTLEAQRVLVGYIDSRSDKVIASWVVTSNVNDTRRMAFVQGKRPIVDGDIIQVSVWGVASSKVAKSYSHSDWVSADRNRDYKCLERIIEKNNELRDNTWNPVKSSTAGWIARGVAPQIAPHSAKVEPVERSSKTKSDPRPVVVKSEKTNGGNKSSKNKRVQNKKGSIQFNKSNNGDGVKAKSNGTFRSIAGSTTKKSRRPPTPAPVSKKTRRVVEESEDEESDDDKSDAFEEERKAMEAEELEVERAAKERDSCLPAGKDEPDAEVVDVVEDDAVKKEKNITEQKKKNGSKKRRSVALKYEKDEFGMDYQRKEQDGKRIWEAQFGKKDDAERKKYKLIEVEETVQLENGYIGTKRVKKYVDESGNEKRTESKAGQSAKKKAKTESSNPSQDSLQSDAKKKEMAPVGFNKSAAKPKKKSNGSGSIKNYFGKRAK